MTNMKPKAVLTPVVSVYLLEDGTEVELLTVDGDWPGETVSFDRKDGLTLSDTQHVMLGEAITYNQIIERYTIDIFGILDFKVFTIPFQDSPYYEDIYNALKRLGFRDYYDKP